MRLLLTAVCLFTLMAVVHSQPLKANDTVDSDKEIKKLINQLTEIEWRDTVQFGEGKYGAMGGKFFLPFLKGESYWDQKELRLSDRSRAFVALVKYGPKAIPLLLEHLKDDRPTRIRSYEIALYSHDLEGNETREEFWSHSVSVGDMCFAALGQIVNRPYSPFEFGFGRVSITPVSKKQKLQDQLHKLWSGMTPEKHRDALLKDIESGKDELSEGAYIRLAYFHPEAFETAAIRQLIKPTYNVDLVNDFITKKLYPANTTKERKMLVDELVLKHGKIYYQGIQAILFSEFERDEKKYPCLPRECLIDVFGWPVSVNYKDRPKTLPPHNHGQSHFIRSLQYDESPKVDKMILEMMVKTDDPWRAESCMDRLIGRGYDAEIEKAIQRFPEFKTEEYADRIQKIKSRLGQTRLHAAVELEIPELVERAIRNRVPVDAQARNGRTALHIACDDPGMTEIVAMLLKAKANPNIRDKDGKLAVDYAAHQRCYDLVRELVLVHRSEVTDIFTALIVGTRQQIRAIIKTNPQSLKETDQNGMTPLHVAVTMEKIHAVRDLVEAGADLKALIEMKVEGRMHGQIALHLTADNRETKIAEFLLDAGTDVNFTDTSGKSTLHFAADDGNLDLVKLLLKRKADVSLKDTDGNTALDLAKKWKRTEIVELLEKVK